MLQKVAVKQTSLLKCFFHEVCKNYANLKNIFKEYVLVTKNKTVKRFCHCFFKAVHQAWSLSTIMFIRDGIVKEVKIILNSKLNLLSM